MDLPDIVDLESFAWLNLVGVDAWQRFEPTFTSLTVVGTGTYSGRVRSVGRKIEFQASMVAGTSIASSAGTSYMALPVTPAKGLAGQASMTNDTTKVAVGNCHIDVTNSRCYLPSQSASGNTFNVAGWYEV